MVVEPPPSMFTESVHPSHAITCAVSSQVRPAALSVRPSAVIRISLLPGVTPTAVRGLRPVQWLPMAVKLAEGIVPALFSMGPLAMMSGWVASVAQPPAGIGITDTAPGVLRTTAEFQLHAPFDGAICGITVLLTRR